MPSFESILLKVFIAVIVIVGVIIVILVVPRFLPNPATITPSTTAIDSGQTVFIGVGWKGGSAPYIVTLYSASSGSCTSSSTVLSAKRDQSQPKFVFTVSPTLTTHYCGTVTSSSGSSTISSSVAVTVNPALHTPTLTLSPLAMDSGQSAAVIAKVTESGGSAPYAFTLYSGTSNACSTDTTVVSVSSGVNPITGLAGTTAQFSFAAPTASTYYCATVTNSAVSSTPKTSSAVKFVVNPALSVSVSPAASKLDSGQSVSLSAVASHGTPPYSYQWYSGSACSTPITGQTKSSFSPGALTSTSSFSVAVADNSTGTPSAESCAKTTVAVNSAFARSAAVTIGPSVVLDSGQLADLTVSWAGVGTSPYAVTLTSSYSSDCSSPMATGMNMTDVTSTSTDFQVSPLSTTFYCATVTDGASSPESASTASAATVTVNPTLSPVILLSPSTIDAGQTATLTVRVDLTTGTSPFTVTLYSGASADCSSDTAVVTPLSSSPQSGANPQTGLSGPTTTFSVPAPNSNTYFCAVVTDSAPSPDTETSPSVQFVVNPVLSATVSPALPSVVKGNSISLKAMASGGTPPYLYQWYNGTTCTAHKIAGQTSQTYTTVALKSTSTLSVRVNDSSTGKPAEVVCASTKVTVTAPLVPTLALSPQAVDKGQSTTVTAKVTWSGGSSPYNVTLYSGSSSSCASDTTKVAVTSGSNPQTGVKGTSASFAFASPSSSTYYCAKVTDSAATPATVLTLAVSFAVNPTLGTTLLAISPTAIDSYQYATVTAKVTWSGGSSPYTVILYSGSSSSCASDTMAVEALASVGTAVSFPFSSPESNTYYCVTVVDAGVPHLTASSATSLFSVNPALSVGAPVISPTVLDSGQSTTVTAKVTWSGGSSPYTVTLYNGSSSSCASDTTPVAVTSGFNPQTGVKGASASFTFAPPGSVGNAYYCAIVIDNSAISVPVLSGTSSFTLNPALTRPVIGVILSAIDVGQSSTLSASFSGGTSPYVCQWLKEAPGASAFSNLGASFSCTAVPVPTSSTGTLSTVGNWSYELQVTDGSSTPMKEISDPAYVTVEYGPQGVGSNPNTGMVYVADPGSNHVSVIDSLSNTVIGTITVGNQPWGIAVNPLTNCVGAPSVCWGTVYVTNYGSNTVTVINGSNNAVIATIPVGMQPEGIAVNPSLGVAYVADSGSDAVSVLDTTANTVMVTGFPVGSAPQSVAVGPSPTYTVFVTDYGSNTVSVVGVDVHGLPYGLTNVVVGSNPWGIAVNQLTNRVYVTNSGSGTVSVLNGSTYAMVATIKVGSTPEGITIDQAASTALVANAGSGTVSVINTLTNTATTSTSPPIPIPVESSPWGVAFLSPANLAYVTNSASNTVSVINLLTNEVITTIIVS